MNKNAGECVGDEAACSLLVVGAGTMGAGIGQVAATAGERVYLYDARAEVASAAKSRVAASLERAVGKKLIEAAIAERALANIFAIESLESGRSAPVVIEAVKEDALVKEEVFRCLEDMVGPETILLTNTSMISITTLASRLKYPGRFAGAHFFNPVPRMQLVEIIAGEDTEDSTIAAATEMVVRWGKVPVRAPDRPGFIVNRVFDALKRESLALLEEGVSAGDIDRALKLGLNFPMGPFELMDLIGLDTTYDCLCNQARQMGRAEQFGTVLPGLVASGKHGRKTGAGFYDYQ